MSNVKISVIVPSYNCSTLISETISSVLSQSYSNWELIIVDDGSTDDTMSVVSYWSEKDQRIYAYGRLSAIKGASSCRNEGAQNASGKYLLFLDADDLLAPECLESRIHCIEKSGVELLVSRMEEFCKIPGDMGRLKNLYPNDDDDSYLKMYLRLRVPWQTSCALWHKPFFHSIGGFDPLFSRLQDPEIHTKALFQRPEAIKVITVGAPDCFYRVSGRRRVGSYKFIDNGIRYIDNCIKLADRYPGMVPDDELIFLLNGAWRSVLKSALIRFPKLNKSTIERFIKYGIEKGLINENSSRLGIPLLFVLNAGASRLVPRTSQLVDWAFSPEQK